MDLGAMTPFFYMMRDRERILHIFEDLCGARMTLNYMQVGGVSHDINEDITSQIEDFLYVMPGMLAEYRELLDENEIILSRSKDIGTITPEDAIDLGVTGPLLRACGKDYDIRKDHPYSIYERMKFKVPTRTEGDVYARYLVRMEEIEESMKIIRQTIRDIPGGIIQAKVPRIITPPIGDIYSRIESPKGELGFYLVSDGRKKPYRLRVRSPCFCNLSSLEKMAEGGKLADLVAINGSMDMIMGEVDR
jgi:NADH-quinone oxidoreductase subunit D